MNTENDLDGDHAGRAFHTLRLDLSKKCDRDLFFMYGRDNDVRGTHTFHLSVFCD